jgi:hypothetical protein
MFLGRFFGHISEVLSYFYGEVGFRGGVWPPILLVSYISLAILSSFSSSILSIAILSLNLIIFLIVFRVRLLRMFKIVSTALIFISLFISPYIVYALFVYGYLIGDILFSPVYGVFYVVARSLLAVSYISMIPLTLGVNGIILAFSSIRIDRGIVFFFLSVFRVIQNLIDEVVKLVLGRVSRRVGGDYGFMDMWRGLAVSIGEFILRSMSTGYLVGLGFRSRVLIGYVVGYKFSIRYSLLYAIYVSILVTLLSLHMVMVL